MVKRLLCLFSAFIVLFSASFPAQAMGTLPIGFEIGLDVASLADLLVSGVRIFGNSLASAFDSDVCGHAPQIGGGHKFVPQRTQVDGQIGLYYVCEYCGKTAGEVLDNTYEAYVETLPGTTVNSDGSFIWKPAPSDFVGVSHDGVVYSNTVAQVSFVVGSSAQYQNLTSLEAATITRSNYSVVSVRPRDCIFLSAGNYNVSSLRMFVSWYWSVKVPVSGYYTCVAGIFDSSSNVASMKNVLILEDTILDLGRGITSYYKSTFLAPWPAFLVVPFDDSPFSSDMRVSGADESSGTGFYGYVEEGQLYQSTVRDIFNETNNTYNNPVTGDTSNVESWVYDYSDRSYTLNTEEGDTVTVTYGDSNVTINEGGDIYNVYYLVEHEDLPEHNYTSSVTLAPTCTGTGVRTYTCADCGDTYTETIPATGHSYQSAVTLPPTCTNTGVRTFTCSVCGDSYTASIPATGHTWQVLQTVSTEYDQTGQLIREGYTIYQCSTCGEQYRIASASGGSSLPLPSSGGTSTGGTDLIEIDSSVGRGFLATIAHGLTEDLPAVLRAASAWFVEFPAFYSGFASFLKDGIAGCLPDVPRQMMGFGLGMVTLIGIVRKVIGR